MGRTVDGTHWYQLWRNIAADLLLHHGQIRPAHSRIECFPPDAEHYGAYEGVGPVWALDAAAGQVGFRPEFLASARIV
jgi:hypothetical protein